MARAIWFAGAHSRMGCGRTDDRPAVAVVCGRLRRAGVVLYFTAEREPVLALLAQFDRAARDRAWPLRHRFGLCRRDAQDRADPASGAALSSFRRNGRRFCGAVGGSRPDSSLCAGRGAAAPADRPVFRLVVCCHDAEAPGVLRMEDLSKASHPARGSATGSCGEGQGPTDGSIYRGSTGGGHFGPAVPQSDGAVEHQPAGCKVRVGAEIALPLELHHLAGF